MSEILLSFYEEFPVWAAPLVYFLLLIALIGRHRYPGLYRLFSAGRSGSRSTVLLIAAVLHVLMYWIVVADPAHFPAQARQGMFRFSNFFFACGLCIYFLPGTLALVYKATGRVSRRLNQYLFKEMVWELRREFD